MSMAMNQFDLACSLVFTEASELVDDFILRKHRSFWRSMTAPMMNTSGLK